VAFLSQEMACFYMFIIFKVAFHVHAAVNFLSARFKRDSRAKFTSRAFFVRTLIISVSLEIKFMRDLHGIPNADHIA